MMFLSRIGASLVAAIVFVGCASFHDHEQHARAPVGWTPSLDQLGITGTLDALAQPPQGQVKYITSRDPEGGNKDDRFGEKVFDGGLVLADLEGPGCVTRIWSRNPSGTLYVFVDDIEHPALVVGFADLFAGALELHSPGFNLFSPPFVGQGNGGYSPKGPVRLPD